ncbi:MAG: adenylosuccinate synthase [Firmicutes bacterium]|nr:adenylosuccinate synthase [Bacillota bacterium]
MAATVIVGLQFGDEGKGKITDYLAGKADMVVRSQGGANAGHTVVIDGQRFSLHQVPSGIFRGRRCVIGNGVVLDAPALVEELDGLRARGVDVSPLAISDRAHLVLPYHPVLDGVMEDSEGERRIGTTRRGIGPAYADKMARLGVRVVDLMSEVALRRRLAEVAGPKNRLLRSYGLDPVEPDALADRLLAAGERLRPYVTDTSRLVNDALDRGENVLFEGAQGTFLDVDLGTYPFVTSSHPVAGGVTVGAGVGPTRIQAVVGVMKAYTSRVGEGPFPGELAGEEAERVRQAGQEYGTTTGRPRRVGWLDLVMLRYAARVNGLTGVAVNALDVLGGRAQVPVVVAYRIGGRRVTEVPASAEDLFAAVAELEWMDGWQMPERVRGAGDLPAPVRRYLERIETATGAPVVAVSFGRERSDVLELA